MVSKKDSIWKGRGLALAQFGDSHFVDRYPWPHSEITIFFTPSFLAWSKASLPIWPPRALSPENRPKLVLSHPTLGMVQSAAARWKILKAASRDMGAYFTSRG